MLSAADDYLERLGRFVPTELVRVKEGGLDRERAELEKKLPRAGKLVVLDERGKEPTTRQLAEKLQGWAHEGQSQVTFVIGGADGLHPEIKARGHELMALSKLTLPHRLAQVVLLEQLYRAHSLLRGAPYHRD